MRNECPERDSNPLGLGLLGLGLGFAWKVFAFRMWSSVLKVAFQKFPEYVKVLGSMYRLYTPCRMLHQEGRFLGSCQVSGRKERMATMQGKSFRFPLQVGVEWRLGGGVGIGVRVRIRVRVTVRVRDNGRGDGRGRGQVAWG